MSEAPVVKSINEDAILESLKGNKEALNYIRALKDVSRGWEDLVHVAKKKICEQAIKINELEAQLRTAYGYGSDAGMPPYMK